MAIAITTATNGAHRGLPASARTLVAGMVAVLVAIAPEQVAAASNALSAGKAMPASGTTQTSFTLSVGYRQPARRSRHAGRRAGSESNHRDGTVQRQVG